MDLDPLKVELALGGSREAFQGLVEETWGLVYVFIQQRLSDSERARDLTQDTFLQAYDKRETLRDSGRFLSWLLTIAARKVIDNHRRRSSHPESPLTEGVATHLSDSGTSPTAGLEQEEESAQLREAVAQLDDRYRAVLTLRYWSGLTPAQIARLLDEPEGTIRNRIFRAHARLRKILETAKSEAKEDAIEESAGYTSPEQGNLGGREEEAP